jgi:FkbM family methyltransferase
MPETSSLIQQKQCRHGMMAFLRADQFIGKALELYGEYSEPEVELFAKLLSPGQTVVEVGANIGAHTVPLARLVGPTGLVVAFEPQSVIFQILCANVVLNETFNVRTLNAGSGATPGNLKIPFIDYQNAGFNFGGVSLVDVAQGYDVPIIPLDALELPSLQLLKIDVEGMEIEGLLGAKNKIAKHRPFLYVENDRPHLSAALISLMDGMGYELCWHFPQMFSENNFQKNAENIFGNMISINLIGVPKELNLPVTGFHKVTGTEDIWQNYFVPSPVN